MGQPCLAIHTFIKWSHISSADAVMQGLHPHISLNDRSLPAPDYSPWLHCTTSLNPVDSTTAGGTLVSWDPSPVDMTGIQRSTSYKPSSTQAIRIVSVSCCTLCPRLDGPSDHVNERAIRSGRTVVTLWNGICKGPCPPLYVYRPRFRLCSGTKNLSFLDRTASRCYSCLLPNLFCQVLHLFRLLVILSFR